MKPCTAFVLGGGGSHGALQVGAMRALLEAGIVPDLLVGSSIGAVNAAGLALWGVDLEGVDRLERAWQAVSGAQMLDPRISQLILRSMVGRPSERARLKAERFFTSLGFNHGLRFNMIPWVRLALISADIETGQPVIYGLNPSDSILEGLLASIALPPWFTPYQKDGQLMVDGGALSNLPIEPALRLGATQIYALDLDDIPASLPQEKLGLPQYLGKYLYAVSRRHVDLEKALAAARGVPVHCIDFQGLANAPLWDFRGYRGLIQSGYEKTRALLSARQGKEDRDADVPEVALERQAV